MEVKNENEKGTQPKDGLHISKRTLWMLAGGAIGAVAALGFGKAFNGVRPALVSAAKEGYGFKEWLGTKIDKAKEDLQDVMAEGAHGYHQEQAASAEASTRQEEILERVEKIVEERLAKIQAEKKEKGS
ncbi:MAG: hypothetical protein M1438_05285 [Deltaproteobacteria bacterium]|nr:hypothetical protein [Deltaproteobacteria bacterium]